MGVFAFENGRLVRPPESKFEGGVTSDVLQAVRTSVLELIERPLFPVGWEQQNDVEYLLALDTAGQVVTVEVVPHLDSETFLAALAQTGRNAERTRADLANIYSGGPINFQTEWTRFVDSAPIRTRRGPRLYLFAGVVSPDAVAPLNALHGLGVEGHQIRVHRGAHGDLVEIEPIRVAPAALSSAARVVEIDSAAEPAAAPAPETPKAEPKSAWNITGCTKPEAAEKPASFRSQFSRRAQKGEQPAAQTIAPAAPEPEIKSEPQTKEIPSVSTAGAQSAHILTDTGPLPERKAVGRSAEKDTLYEQLRNSLLRPEQRLWEQAAPKEASEQTIFSERASAAESARAVEEAAWQYPKLTPLVELANIARRGATKLHWYSPRRNIDLMIVLEESGLLRLPDGTEVADPSEAAYRLSGANADGWRVWRTADGVSLGDLRFRH